LKIYFLAFLGILLFATSCDNDYKSLNSKGIGALNGDDPVLAISYFTDAIKKNENFAESYYNRAKAYVKLKKYQNAIDDLNQAIKINDQYISAYKLRGFCNFKISRYREAIGNYSLVIGLYSEDAEAYYMRGRSYMQLGNDAKAREDFISANLLGHKEAERMLLKFF
jgi:tetratricopeptide (TPR) repeat protein